MSNFIQLSGSSLTGSEGATGYSVGAAEFSLLEAITSTAAEINYLDIDDLAKADLQKLADITATADEINDLASNAVDSSDLTKLSNVTATAAELNYLDNDDLESADFVKLAAVTANATELNYTDVTTLGTAQASKAVTVDASNKITLGSVEIEGSAFDIDGGSADALVIGATAQAAAQFTTMSGSGTLRAKGAATFGSGNGAAVIAADGGLTIDHFDANWTNAGHTVADLGTVQTMDLDGGSIDGTVIGASSVAAGSFAAIVGTTATLSAGMSATTISGSGAANLASLHCDSVDLDGGVMDGVVIGANSAAAGTFAAVVASSLNLSEGNITNAGSVALDSITADDGSSFSFGSNWTAASRTCANLGTVQTMDLDGGSIDGAVIGANSAAAGTFAAIVGASVSVAGVAGFAGGYGATGVSINADGDLLANGDLTVDGAANFGAANGYAGDGVSVSAVGAVSMKGALTVGADGAGVDAIMYGAAAGEQWAYSAADNVVAHKDSSGNNIYTLGGDLSSEYALDIADGASNINKVRAAAFVTYSDRNLKTEIAPMSDSLKKVMKLDAVSYKLKSGGTEAPREIGFLAQEVAAVVPEVCAFDAKGESRGIDYSRMSALLADAVKSQQEQIAQLKEIVAKLQK
jgi:hypothetical protein